MSETNVEKVDTTPLGRPLTFAFSGKTAKNLFLKSAMSERLSSWDDDNPEARGVPTKEHIALYQRWAEGGFGTILTGNVMLDYNQLEAAGNPIIPLEAPFSGERFEAFEQIATQAKNHGSLIYAQVSHPGRQVTDAINPSPLSASDVQLTVNLSGSTFAKPKAMDEEDIADVIARFAHAAEYCYKAGFDGIQLHGAHGYLLAQFLAQTTNKRTDKYGGSLENRSRIIFEVADAIRARVPDKSFSLGIKLNSVEFQDGGFQPEEAKLLCQQLEAHEFDWVEISGGTYEAFGFVHKKESTRKREAYFLEFAEIITPALTKTKVFLTGGLRTARGMLGALQSTDGVGFGRPATQEFDLPNRILSGESQAALKWHAEDATALVISGVHIWTVGHGKQPLDMSKQSQFEAVQKGIASFAARLGKRTKPYIGYPDLETDLGHIHFLPYGSVYEA